MKIETLNPKRSASGFSFMELMVTLVIGAILMLGAYRLMSSNTSKTMEIAREMRFSKETLQLQQTLTQALDQIGYNRRLTSYEIAPSDSLSTADPFVRRTGITYFWKSTLRYTADLDENGQISETEHFGLVALNSAGQELDLFQSAAGAEPCSPSAGTVYGKNYSLFSERGRPGSSSYTRTLLADNIRCVEFQYSCQIWNESKDASTAERIDRGLPPPATGCARSDTDLEGSMWKRWKLQQGTSSASDAEAAVANLEEYHIAVPVTFSPVKYYYRFIRDKIQLVRMGVVLQGPCSQPLPEVNPLTGDRCPTEKIIIEKRINPPWRPNLLVGCPGQFCATPNIELAEANATYPSMDTGASTGGTGGTGTTTTTGTTAGGSN